MSLERVRCSCKHPCLYNALFLYVIVQYLNFLLSYNLTFSMPNQSSKDCLPSFAKKLEIFILNIRCKIHILTLLHIINLGNTYIALCYFVDLYFKIRNG